MSSKPATIVIAVAGATRASKTTSCAALEQHFKALGAAAVVVVHQDSCLGGGETPEAVNWRAFRSAIDAAISPPSATPASTAASVVAAATTKAVRANRPRSSGPFAGRRVVIVEGFLLFARPASVPLSLFHVAVFLKIGREECYKRRKATKRAGLGAGAIFDRNFAAIWDAHMKHGQPPAPEELNGLPLVVVDAEQPPDAVKTALLAAVFGILGGAAATEAASGADAADAA